MTPEAQARAMADDVVEQWFSRSLGDIDGWEKWKPIWIEQLTGQFEAALTQARAAEWTMEKPTTAGWYWRKTEQWPKGYVIEMRQEDFDGMAHKGWYEGGLWSGPLLPPGQHANEVKG